MVPSPTWFHVFGRLRLDVRFGFPLNGPGVAPLANGGRSTACDVRRVPRVLRPHPRRRPAVLSLLNDVREPCASRRRPQSSPERTGLRRTRVRANGEACASHQRSRRRGRRYGCARRRVLSEPRLHVAAGSLVKSSPPSTIDRVGIGGGALIWCGRRLAFARSDQDPARWQRLLGPPLAGRPRPQPDGPRARVSAPTASAARSASLGDRRAG